MSHTITAFKESPDRDRGLGRDMRVRWAPEEVGQGLLPDDAAQWAVFTAGSTKDYER